MCVLHHVMAGVPDHHILRVPNHVGHHGDLCAPDGPHSNRYLAAGHPLKIFLCGLLLVISVGVVDRSGMPLSTLRPFPPFLARFASVGVWKCLRYCLDDPSC